MSESTIRRMTFAQRVEWFATKYRLPKKVAERMLFDLFYGIADSALHGDNVHIPGFGVFYRKTRKTRRILDVTTKKAMQLPPSVAVGFRCSKVIKR